MGELYVYFAGGTQALQTGRIKGWIFRGTTALEAVQKYYLGSDRVEIV